MKEKKTKRMKGQISLFVAFVFIVLFALFSMVISVGMFVHDKINLQNSTDLASYYVGTKQAELLGAIAHTNYQIRQSWKLLTFRYRVFANASRTREFAPGGVPIRHPGIRANFNTYRNNEDTYVPADFYTDPGGTTVPPRICIWASHLFKESNNDNTCQTINFSAPYLSELVTIINTGGIGPVISGIAATNAGIASTGQAITYMNWWFANTIVGAHKFEQRDRRNVIHVLAENLAKPIVSGPEGMRDLEGGNVFDGAKKTFVYNLSESNRTGGASEDLSINGNSIIEIKNSLEGLAPKDWLPPIYVNISLPISTYRTRPRFVERVEEHASNTVREEILNTLLPASTAAQTLKARVDPSGIAPGSGQPVNSPNDFENLSQGVEKNPWYMVYNAVGTKAKSHPVFISSVFGDGINIKATAYSKPFGGRIGPWHKTQWQKGSMESTGPELTDKVTAGRAKREELGQFGDFDKTRVPNYSRFPGDEKGLTTYSSMVAAGPITTWRLTSASSGANIPPTSVQDYHRALYSYLDDNLYNDPLAQDIDAPNGDVTDSFNRRMEVAAIAPDAFDVTYYSVFPSFYDYFIKDKMEKWVPSLLQGFVRLRGDLGSQQNKLDYDIMDQINVYGNEVKPKDAIYNIDWPPDRMREAIPWLGASTENSEPKVKLSFLLTGWNSGTKVMDYLPADDPKMNERFAACSKLIQEGKPKIPSNCLQGGRVGYSVKMISKQYILSVHPIGGAGVAPGQIENPVLAPEPGG